MADESTPSTPPVPAPARPTLNPHEAIDLLGDLEARLGQLRQWQTENDQHAEHVRHQAEQIAAREHELSTQRQALENDRGQLDRDRQQLDDQRQALEGERDELETRKQSLTEQQEATDTRQHELDRGHEKLHADREALDQRIVEIDGRAASIDGRIAELDARQAGLDQQQESINEQQGKLDEQWQQIESARAELAEAEAAVEEARREIDEARVTLDGERDTLESDRESVEQDRATLATDRAEFSEQRQALKDRKQELAKAQVDLRLRQDALAAQQESLERARAELSDLASRGEPASSDDTLMPGFIPDFDHLDEAKAPAGPSKQELARREQELADAEAKLAEKKQAFRDRVEASKAKLLARQEKLQGDEQALLELTQQLEEQQAGITEREQQLTQRIEEVEQLKSEFDQSADSAETFVGQPFDVIDEEEPAPDSDPGQAEALAQREADFERQRQQWIAEIDADREQVQAQREDLERRAEELDALAQRLDEQQAELEAREAEVAEREIRADTIESAPADDSEKDARIAELTEELAAFQAKYEKRKAQMKQADEVIRERRDKVRGYLQQLREHRANLEATGPNHESNEAQLAGIDRERRNLIEVKKFLETSERAMVQRWATRSTAGLTALILLAIIGAAAFSYVVGQKMTVPLWRATMSLAFTEPAAARSGALDDPAQPDDPAAVAFLMQTTGDQPAGESAGETAPAIPAPEAAPASNDWLAGFRELVYGPAVLNEALNQMEQRGVRRFTSAEQLAAHLEGSLTIEGSPERVTLTYADTQPEHVDRVLESLGRAVVVRQMSLDRAAGRPDTLKILNGGAQRDNTPQHDEALKYSAVSFGILLGLALVLGLIIRVALGRSRRLMDDPEAAPMLSTLDKPGTWSPVPSGAAAGE